MQVIFSVPGKVQGKGRPRAAYFAGRAKIYTPDTTTSYEEKIRGYYLRKAAGVRFAPPIKLEVMAVYAVPKSYSKRKAADCMANRLRPTAKPDVDNIVKVVADALNGAAYKDDAGIAVMTVEKRYGPEEKLLIRVSGDPIESPDAPEVMA